MTKDTVYYVRCKTSWDAGRTQVANCILIGQLRNQHVFSHWLTLVDGFKSILFHF